MDPDDDSGTLITRAPPGPRACRVSVAAVTGPDAPKSILLESGAAVIGTDPACDLVLGDRTVSRRHLELRLAEEGLHVRDLGSSNGTYHGGARVTTLLLLGPARLRLGALTELDVQFAGGPAQAQARPSGRFGNVVGSSPAMQKLFALLDGVAGGAAPVLLLGETGTGKELLAEAIHRASPRRDGPLVVVDCGALPRDLVGSELFGHARGAFTGASDSKRGLIEAADQGTLFLDEIGELPLDLQPQLLRVLEKREIRPIGDTRSRKVDLRVIAATHRDLKKMARDGQFREDLYFRLAVIAATVPPLRERREDIPLLARHFLAALGRPDFMLSDELMARMLAYDWPGNVRELRNIVERTVSLRGQPDELALPLPASIAPGGADDDEVPDTMKDPPLPAGLLGVPFKEAKTQLIESFEREYLTQLLARHHGNVSRAAQEAGIDRNHIHRLVRRYNLATGRG